MNKKILLTVLFWVSLFVSFDIVKGVDIGGYWGSSITGSATNTGMDCPNSQYFCGYNNSNTDGTFRHQTIAITFAYIDHGNVQKIGNTIFVTNNTSALSNIGIPVTNDGPIKLYTTINTWCSANGRQMTSDLYDEEMLDNFFKNDVQNFERFVSCMGVDHDTFNSLTKDSIPTPGDKGYRLIIEPVKTGKIWGISYLKTVKEIANIGTTGRYFNSTYQFQYNIYQTVADVGITAAPTGQYTSATGNTDPLIRSVASSTTGYGLALVDVKSSLPTKKTCPQIKATLTRNSTEYFKFMNDIIWLLLNDQSVAQDVIDCFTCKEYIDYYDNASNPFISHTEADKQLMLDAIKRTGKISWTNSACSVGSNSCESFKTANPAATYADMVAANSKWPGCYSCEPTSANYNIRYNELMPEEDKPAACKTTTTRDLCDFTLDISISTNCRSTSRSHVYDIEDWACIFNSTIADDNKIKEHFIQEDMEDNPYCSVYCREEVDYQYPSSSMIVLAGQRFTIGNGYGAFPVLSPVRFKSVTTCRTTSDAETGKIDLEKFRADYQTADNTVKTEWDEYQTAKKQQYAVDNATNVSASKDCNWTCDSYYPTYPCPSGRGTCGGGCRSGSYKSHMKKPATVTYNYDDGRGNVNITPGNYCSNNKPDYSVSSKLTDYNNAVTARTNVVKDLHECNSFQYTNRKFNPNVEFAYEEDMYGNLNGDTINYSKFNNTLTSSVSFSSKTKYYTGGDAATATGTNRGSKTWSTSSYKSSSVDMFASRDHTSTGGATGYIESYECSTDGQTCKHTTSSRQKYEINDWVEQTTTKTYNYSLANNVYRYITKPSGLSVHTSGEAMAESPIYYDVGTSNLPVHYSRNNGRYDYLFQHDTFGELSGGISHKFDHYIFDGGSIDITYGEFLNVYSAMLADANVRSKLQHCNAADHLGHGMPDALRRIGLLDDFLNSTCGRQHNCYVYGSDVVCDTYYVGGVAYNSRPCSTYSNRCGTTASYTTYSQVADCVARYAITTGNVAYPSRDTAYKCTYNVEQKLIISRDLNLIYRPISLNNPFPGQTGTNRTPGANWNSRPVINVAITSNRDVEKENIYKDLDPLYKITLTPALIKEIRRYNDAQDGRTVTYYNGRVGEITGNAGYSDFGLTCTNGRHCLSNFIRNSVSIGGRSYNFSRYFSGCGIDDTGLRCNTGEEW